MRTLPFVLCSLLLGAAGCASNSAAPATPASSKPAAAEQFGVIVMAHGGTPEWNAAVEQTVAPLRSKYQIEVAFGMADAASLQEAVRKLEARHVHRIGVVRLFISGESWYERTEQIFGLRGGAPPAPNAKVDHSAHAGHGGHDPHAGHAAAGAPIPPHPAGHGGHSMEFYRVEAHSTFLLSKDGLADEPSMGRILAERAQTLSKDPAREDVLILAHGPGDDGENARWIEKIDQRAAAIRMAAPFRRVQVETLREDWPDKRVDAEKRIREFVARANAEGGKAIVLPFRVQGFGPYANVLEGLNYVSDGQGLIPHAEVGAWIERQIAALAARS
jgi:hypothetical protein